MKLTKRFILMGSKNQIIVLIFKSQRRS